jgi:hypothetical protein
MPISYEKVVRTKTEVKSEGRGFYRYFVVLIYAAITALVIVITKDPGKVTGVLKAFAANIK